MLLQECKYVIEEKKMPKYITEDIEISSDDSGKKNSDEENFDEEYCDEENSNEESNLDTVL